MPSSRSIAFVVSLCLSAARAAAQENPPQPQPTVVQPQDAAAPPQVPAVRPPPARQEASPASPGEVPVLGETVVTGTRTPAHLRDVPASVSVVTRRDIEETHVTRVEELLLPLPGVDQAQPLAGGAPGAPRLRGLPGTFAGATTLVLVDGMPVEPVLINNRQGWLLVAPQNVERLEVVRGPASVLYGPSAAGGVINIITRSGRGAPFAELSGGYGAHDTYQLGFGGGGTLADVVDVMVGGTLYRTGGYRPWPETPARWAPYYPSGLNDLDGRDSEDKTLQVRLGVRPSDHQEVSVAYRYFDVGGAWLGGHPSYRWDRHGGMADLAYRWRPTEALELKARVQRSEFNNRVRYDSNAFNGDGVLDLAEVDREREQAWHGDLQLDARLLAANVLTVGGSWEEGELTGKTFDNLGVETGVNSGKSQVLAVYMQDQQKLLGDVLVLQAGGRFDRYRFSGDSRDGRAYPGSRDDVYNYRAGLRVNPAPSTSLYASTGTAYLPALNTLKYRRPGGPWLDNPGLEPERSVSYEVGGTQELARRTSVTLSLFHTVYRDKITAAQVGARRQYQNLAEVTVKGLEAAAETAIVRHLRAFANYTLTAAEIGKDPSAPATEGMRPAYTPKHKAGAGVSYSDPRLVAARVAGRWVGAQYSSDTNAADTRMSSFLTVDARVARGFSLGASREIVLSVAAENILDRRYAEWNDELADGRRFSVELALKL